MYGPFELIDSGRPLSCKSAWALCLFHLLIGHVVCSHEAAVSHPARCFHKFFFILDAERFGVGRLCVNSSAERPLCLFGCSEIDWFAARY